MYWQKVYKCFNENLAGGCHFVNTQWPRVLITAMSDKVIAKVWPATKVMEVDKYARSEKYGCERICV